MLELQLPTSETPDFTYRTELDGKSFRLSFDWNTRSGAWYMSIADVDDVDVISGVKLVVNFPLLRLLASDARPGGEMYVLTPDDTDPTIDTIEDATLIYVPVST